MVTKKRKPDYLTEQQKGSQTTQIAASTIETFFFLQRQIASSNTETLPFSYNWQATHPAISKKKYSTIILSGDLHV